MTNTTTSIRAILHICHRPLTFRDVTTWDHKPEMIFTSKEDFKAWVKELIARPHMCGGTYIEVWQSENGTPPIYYSTKYAYWPRLIAD